ncbi:MAG: transcription termination/antitermination protein NusA [Dictyoglomus sp. NZ13-RE01]|nr:MAG: transcription termination/antitermination protein NusA [Dictyoglomus sp. NZ13-RE01]
MKLGEDFWVVLEQIIKEKKINRETILEALRRALLSAFKKTYGTSKGARVEIDLENQEIKIYVTKKVVDQVKDPMAEISLADSKNINENSQQGDEIEIEVEPQEFGRIAVQVAKQVIIQSLKEAERRVLYEKYKAKEGEIIGGSILRIERGTVYVKLPDIEAILPYKEQIPGEQYLIGRRIRAYLLEVQKTTKEPLIILSRSHPNYLKRLLELEVPEIKDGIVEIMNVVRDPGVRAKVAVRSNLPEVDPIGACIGFRGQRIQNVINELNGEKIDLILWSSDPAEYIARSLAPAKPIRVELHEDERKAVVIVPPDQLSLAIGKDGQNVRLAVRLTSWKIDIRTEDTKQEGKVEDKAVVKNE